MSTPKPATSKPTTPKQYLDALPADRKKAIQAIRKTINTHRDTRLKEGIQYGMVGWFVPHSVYPDGYHCDPAQPLPFASVASQKNHIGIYLFCLYTDEKEQARFVKAWKATGKRLDMGKSCIRVKILEDIPMDVLGEAISRMDCDKFIGVYESQFGAANKATRKKAAKKAGSKKTVAKKTASKKVAKKSTSTKAGVKKTASKKAASSKPPTKKTTKKKTTKKSVK